MTVMKLKEFRRRFRTWQGKSIKYYFKEEGIHHCANCGHDFEGNFCPLCGQSMGDGRITWKSLISSFINILIEKAVTFGQEIRALCPTRCTNL